MKKLKVGEEYCKEFLNSYGYSIQLDLFDRKRFGITNQKTGDVVAYAKESGGGFYRISEVKKDED